MSLEEIEVTIKEKLIAQGFEKQTKPFHDSLLFRGFNYEGVYLKSKWFKHRLYISLSVEGRGINSNALSNATSRSNKIWYEVRRSNKIWHEVHYSYVINIPIECIDNVVKFIESYYVLEYDEMVRKREERKRLKYEYDCMIDDIYISQVDRKC